uniref:Uncharacterized protein n=1 Tax=Rhizophora mucronata TaxID=61149 RepID=A0A2P2P3P2_RHIMU
MSLNVGIHYGNRGINLPRSELSFCTLTSFAREENRGMPLKYSKPSDLTRTSHHHHESTSATRSNSSETTRKKPQTQPSRRPYTHKK